MDQPQKPTETQVSLRPTLGLLPILAITAAAVPAFAQETTTLDTIVVQADGKNAATSYTVDKSGSEKVLTPLVDTPKSITVITEREISERGATTLEDVIRTTPGITLGTGEGGNPAGTMPKIRGNDATNDVMVDGMRSNLRTDYEVFNLETVEITKGPGGSAAGTGSTGGTINMVSKAPLPGKFDDVSLSLGTGAFKRFTLDSNRQIGALGARLNLMYQDADLLYGRDGRTSKRYGIAPSVSYQLNEATKLTAGIYYFKNEDLIDYGVPLSTADVPDEYRRGSGTVDDPWEPIDVPTDTYYTLKDRDMRDATTRSAYVRADHEFSPNLKWSTTLRTASNESAYVPSIPVATATGVNVAAKKVSSYRTGNDVALNSQLTGETVFGGAKHTFAVGVDYSIAKVRVKSMTTAVDRTELPASVILLFEDPDTGTAWLYPYTKSSKATQETKYTSLGLYAFDVVELAPKWDLSFGLRYDKYKAKNTVFETGVVTENNSHFWNSNIGLSYKPAENGTVYVSVGTSSNPAGEANGVGGGTNEAYQDLDPERAYSYEIGTKWSLFNDQVLLTAALFKTEKDNARAMNAEGVYENIGKTRSQGVELGIAGQINEKWGVSAGYTYTDAKTLEAGYSCNSMTGVCEANSSTGSRVSGIPLNSLAIWTTYDVTEQWTVGGGVTYMDKRPMNADRTFVLPAQTRVDLMTSYEVAENTQVQLNVNNVFDKQLYTGNRGNQFVNVEPGRNFMVTLKHRF